MTPPQPLDIHPSIKVTELLSNHIILFWSKRFNESYKSQTDNKSVKVIFNTKSQTLAKNVLKFNPITGVRRQVLAKHKYNAH